MRPSRTLLAIALAGTFACASLPAAAGVFDDDYAREQIIKTNKDLADSRSQTNARLDKLETQHKERTETIQRTQLDLSNQIETLRAELAKLRGQLEVIQHDTEASSKRQKDFYVDLDGRLRKVETAASELATKISEVPPPPPPKPKVDPEAEPRAYESAINLFKDRKYQDAQNAFQSFVRDYPTSSLLPSAQFWYANSLYLLRDCKGAIEANRVVVDKHPASSVAPDALLAVATCQQEQGDAVAARKTMESLVSQYPKSPAADSARLKLKRK